jgi:translocator protein
LQGAIWVIFFSFNYIYFNKKSTILAAIWTMADAVLATTSLAIAAKLDKKLAGSYLPLTVWTLFASTLADYQALKNDDPILHTKAMLD